MNWLKKQAEVAKIAWTIIVILASLFGYQITLKPTSEPIEQRLSIISQQLDRLNNQINAIKPN
jgi:hypothetical protein